MGKEKHDYMSRVSVCRVGPVWRIDSRNTNLAWFLIKPVDAGWRGESKIKAREKVQAVLSRVGWRIQLSPLSWWKATWGLWDFCLGRLRKWPLFMVSERCVNTSEIQVLNFLPWEPFGIFQNWVYAIVWFIWGGDLRRKGDRRGNRAPESATQAGEKVTLHRLEPLL